ncbi:hypothetical protein ElyMa_000922700 [Elysia marginata]|uniref:Uncharacterized protein n=1 Tax=Elysia marginata TaxID=1093978 RepID=A0AAV4HAV7_9GAST|nr:hypothetical protein ElyMa_000922700 [Elysia marginata]
MSYFLSEKVKEKIAAGETTYIQEQLKLESFHAAEKDPPSAPPALEELTPGCIEEVSSRFPFGSELEGFVYVLCFLVLLSAFCGWLDRWVTHNRELEVARSHASEALGSFQAVLERGITLATSRQHNVGQGQVRDLEPPDVTGEVDVEESSISASEVTQATTEEVRTVDGATGGESCSKNKVQSSRAGYLIIVEDHEMMMIVKDAAYSVFVIVVVVVVVVDDDDDDDDDGGGGGGGDNDDSGGGGSDNVKDDDDSGGGCQ